MTTDKEVVITRTFDAPRERVWKALSEAGRLAQWWGPKGFAMNVATLDFRPGGMFHYSMTPPGGQPMWGKFVYEEINAPDTIVFINSFSDAAGGITPNPWNPAWALEVRNTLTLEEHDGKTTITIRGWPVRANPEQEKMYEEARAAMQEGFKGTWEKLDEHLASATF